MLISKTKIKIFKKFTYVIVLLVVFISFGFYKADADGPTFFITPSELTAPIGQNIVITATKKNSLFQGGSDKAIFSSSPAGGIFSKTECILDLDFISTLNCIVDFTAEKAGTFTITAFTVEDTVPPTTLKATTSITFTGTASGSVSTDTIYTMLAPLPGLGSDGTDRTIDTAKSDTNPCPFGKYLNILIKLFLGIAGVLAVVMIVWGGVQYMTSELISSKEEGKKSITNAIFGLLLALGAYLILNTINPDLLNVCLNNLPKAEITISPDYMPQTPINGKYCTKTAGANGGYLANADWQTIAGNPKTPTAGTTVNPTGDCAKVGDQHCTSLRGINLNKVETIKTNCPNCEIIITGGTECWLHGGPEQNTTHGPNNSTIDLSATNSLNKFFTGSETFPNDNSEHTAGGITCKAEPMGSTSSTTAKHWHCGGTSGGGSTQGEVYDSVAFVPSNKSIVLTVNNYDANKEHKVMLSNAVNNYSVIKTNPNFYSGQIMITLSQSEYDKLKGASKAQVMSAGISLGVKDLVIP